MLKGPSFVLGALSGSTAAVVHKFLILESPGHSGAAGWWSNDLGRFILPGTNAIASCWLDHLCTCDLFVRARALVPALESLALMMWPTLISLSEIPSKLMTSNILWGCQVEHAVQEASESCRALLAEWLQAKPLLIALGDSLSLPADNPHACIVVK